MNELNMAPMAKDPVCGMDVDTATNRDYFSHRMRGDTGPEGWEQVAGDYALEGYRSVADVVDPVSLQKVRDYKKQKKAAAKAL